MCGLELPVQDQTILPLAPAAFKRLQAVVPLKGNKFFAT